MLELSHPIAQQREAVSHDQPERTGLGIEMCVERARGEPRTFRQRIDAGPTESAGAKAAPRRLYQPVSCVAFAFLGSRHLILVQSITLVI